MKWQILILLSMVFVVALGEIIWAHYQNKLSIDKYNISFKFYTGSRVNVGDKYAHHLKELDKID